MKAQKSVNGNNLLLKINLFYTDILVVGYSQYFLNVI